MGGDYTDTIESNQNISMLQPKNAIADMSCMSQISQYYLHNSLHNHSNSPTSPNTFLLDP